MSHNYHEISTDLTYISLPPQLTLPLSLAQSNRGRDHVDWTEQYDGWNHVEGPVWLY